jgi:TonB family protein
MFRIQKPALLMASTALCLVACGGAISSESGGIVPGSALRRDGRSCGLAAVPDSVPSVQRLVDSSAVGHLAEVSAVSAELVYGLRFSPQGQLAGIKLLEPADPTPLAHPYRDLISRTIRAQTPQEGVWGLRLMIRTGENPEIAVRRSELCQPVPLRTGMPGRSSGTTIIDPQEIQDLRNARPCRLLIRVNESGVVGNVEIIQSSGSSILDRNAVESWQKRRFDPATLDGTPVSWEFPTSVRVRFR